MTTTPSTRRSDLHTFLALPGLLRLLLITQLAFNIGFYLVVPFLASYLGDELHLAGWMIGVILGLRTFSQQGMFFFGGAIADRFGIRLSIVVGCLIRITAFLTLGLTRELPGVIIGVTLIGLAAALFSPATESAIVAWGRDVEHDGGPTLQEIVGLESMCSKLGSVIGPVLGGVLLVIPFRATCLVAAGIFALILAAQLHWLPRDARIGEPTTILDSLATVLHNRTFLTFAAIHSTYLLTYNQLYLAVPVELARIGAPATAITWLFALAAVLTITLQLPVTRRALRWGTPAALRRGYLLLSACFLVVAVAAPYPTSGPAAYLPVVTLVVLLHLGQMLVLPAARDTVAELARHRCLGSYLGFLSSLGGLAVLIGSTAAGRLLDLARTPNPGAPVPWLFLAALPACSAIAVTIFCRRHPAAAPAPTRS
ncbi:Major Facilitator Superfamily protein [Austwickia chelonae]|uniref:Putative major facilitator superfamily transporter n=1 Tax=Austwickia chelonae NBRC 105200 TaxID=1184607 RepID=K6VA71_9MICO|nr:MFS transporter [Austwickia chelonae]GAB79128.1 putative major facilitator superfamily transporter [Austwickia chelonae NBRC 105200]SEW42507.1 Major Facilitator Superfamily protein [Austwickia chelonae]